jgi:hypothetical protein
MLVCHCCDEGRICMHSENDNRFGVVRRRKGGFRNGLLALVIGVSVGALSMEGGAGEVEWKHFRGICDASAMEMLDADLFLVADDEDNVLRLYSRSKQGFPVATYDFSRFLGLQKKKKEIDFEGSARVDDTIFFISSHGANKKGKPQPSRHRIFAVQVEGTKERPEIRPAGFYSDLLSDLMRAPELSAFDFRKAALLPPKSEGALNIEGLTATAEGHLLVGFRNPIPGGQALVVPILNPKDLIRGQRAKLGKPMQLNLNGLGIRSMAQYKEGFLIVAGSYSGEGASQLYQWDGKSSEAKLEGVGMPGNPEGIAVVSNSGRDVVFALSDDGTAKIGDRDCKKLKDSSLKVFRAYEMRVGLELTRK